MTDNQLIDKILAGSIDDYAILIDRYQEKLQSALCFYCQSRSDIEQFLHETFVKAYSKLSTFDHAYKFYPWLKMIAINLLREEIRKNNSLSAREAKYLQEQLTLEEENGEEGFKLDALKGCMGELEQSQKELMELRYWTKCSIESLAGQLQKKPSAL